MKSVFWKKLGVCNILFASLIVASGPAAAKVTIQCKNPIEVSGGILPFESAAQDYAKNKWMSAVYQKYGSHWIDFSKAKNIHFQCQEVKGGWTCWLTAKACAQVKPPSPSAYHLKIPPQRWQRPQNKRSLQRYRFAPPVRTQHLRPRFRSTAPRSISRLR
jgi:hypothetical protein